MQIRQIKQYLMSKIGSKVVIVYHGGRNHRERFDGILYKIYDNIFIIKTYQGNIKSFTYIDILTKTIQIYI